MSLTAPESSPASSLQPSIGHTSPPSTAAPPFSVIVAPSPMAVPETIASPAIAHVQPPPEISDPPLWPPLPLTEGSPPPLPPLTPPESSSPPPLPPLTPPEGSPPPLQPLTPPGSSSPPPSPPLPPEGSPPPLPPLTPPGISSPPPSPPPPPLGKATSPIHEPSTPLPGIISPPPPVNDSSPPENPPLPPMTSPAKPPPEPNTAPASIPTPVTNPRHPDTPIHSPETRVQSPLPPSVVGTPLKPNVTASPRNPPKFRNGSVPPASSIQPPELQTGSIPPALSSSVSPQTKHGALSPQGSNGSAPMSIGDEGVSVGRSSISKGIIAGGVFGGFLIFLMIGLLVYVYLKGRKGKKKIGMGCNGIPLAWSKDKGDSELPPNWKQNIPPPASHVVTVLTSSLPSPPLRSRVGDTSFANSAQSPQALGVNFGISSGWLTYDVLVKATNNFSKANLIGQGGFAHVYKGVLSNGKEVAVKQLKIGSGQGEREFQAEVDTISRVHHKHLVSLIGYSITGSDRLLVFEFVPNNTLEFHLHRKEQSVMEWSTRMKIAIGSAKGLAYLHEDCHPAIIHRDIKASNILLDFKFEAKVSDFGLAKSFPDNGTSISHIFTRVMGTFGYLAPEYASSGQVTERSDVYSYGVMLLELLTGHPPISTNVSSQIESLVGWAWPLLIRSLEDGIYDTLVDPKLHGCYNSNEMARMVACATACVQHSARLRPKMSQIIRALEGDISLTDIIESIRARYVFYGSSESSRYDVHEYNIERKKFERILASQEHAVTGDSQTTSEYGLHPSDSSSEYQNYQRETESMTNEIFKK